MPDRDGPDTGRDQVFVVDDYYEALRLLHETIRPDSYLEIGVRYGDSLALASPDTLCVGIDWNMEITAELPQRCHLFTATSDDFFKGDDLSTLLAGTSIDLAFIDGMHLFEYALRDFMNIERYADSDTLVVVHDCIPRDAETSQREMTDPDFWTGDVWKLVPILHEFRPGLKTSIVEVPPSGLYLISGLDPDSRVLSGLYAEIVAEYRSRGFESYESCASVFEEVAMDMRSPFLYHGVLSG